MKDLGGHKANDICFPRPWVDVHLDMAVTWEGWGSYLGRLISGSLIKGSDSPRMTTALG